MFFFVFFKFIFLIKLKVQFFELLPSTNKKNGNVAQNCKTIKKHM